MRRAKRGLYGFKTFSERGAWVEMMFMATASFKGYRVLKPWGDALPYDVGVEVDGRLMRVQVKSTSHKIGGGYRCEFAHSSGGRIQRYSVDELDVCAGYVIPKKVWYLIPARLVTGCMSRGSVTLCQFGDTRKISRYEAYREAWEVLGKERGELAEE
jgi:hypothetical protein